MLARKVAEQCQNDVCQLVMGRMDSMTLSEARGYIRARATPIVSRACRRHLASLPRVDSAFEESISRLAAERIIPHAIRIAQVGVPRLADLKVAA